MNREQSPKRVTQAELRKQATKDAKSNFQINRILGLWKDWGLFDQSLKAFKNSVALWNLQDQEKFFLYMDVFGCLFVKLDYAQKILDENASLAVVAIFLHVDRNDETHNKMASRLIAGLSAQERQEVWRLHCLRELPEFLQYLPNVHTRLHLLLPEELREPCKSNTSLRTVWTGLPEISDWNHKLRVCSSWYLKKALALRPGDKIWEKVTKKYDDLGLFLRDDPDFETLRAQLTQ